MQRRRFVRLFDLGRERTLQLRAECFNVPNHPNFSVPSGRTTSTTTTSRQIQLGLKFGF